MENKTCKNVPSLCSVKPKIRKTLASLFTQAKKYLLFWTKNVIKPEEFAGIAEKIRKDKRKRLYADGGERGKKTKTKSFYTGQK